MSGPNAVQGSVVPQSTGVLSTGSVPSAAEPSKKLPDLPGGILTASSGDRQTSPDGKVRLQSMIDFRNAIATPRRQQLDALATTLVTRHSELRWAEGPRAGLLGMGGSTAVQRRELNYHDMARLLTELKKLPLSDFEKAFVWTRVVGQENKGADSGPLGGGRFEGGRYTPSIDGVRPEMIDSDPGRQLNTPKHSHVGFSDGAHGFGYIGGTVDAEHRGLGYVSRDQASETIRQRETRPLGLGINTGDQRASQAIVDAFHAFRDASAGHQFEAFANTWIKLFVNK